MAFLIQSCNNQNTNYSAFTPVEIWLDNAMQSLKPRIFELKYSQPQAG